MGMYVETIKSGAFKKTLGEHPDVVLDINHGTAGSGLPIARTSAGTLRLAEDGHGLAVDAYLDPEDPDVALVARKMSRGDLDGQMSFAFTAVKQLWSDDYTQRTISEASLRGGDVSIVVTAANPATTSSIRSAVSKLNRSASLTDRRKMAAVVSTGRVVVEMRSFTLDGVRYEMRNPDEDDVTDGAGHCNRCGGGGTIVLQGKGTTCPQCRGTGTAENNAKVTDGDGQTLSAPSLAAARASLEALRYPPRRASRGTPTSAAIARLGLERLRLPPRRYYDPDSAALPRAYG
jgi:uncharacterized protein